MTIAWTSLAVPADVLPNMAFNRDRHTSCETRDNRASDIGKLQSVVGVVLSSILHLCVSRVCSYFNGSVIIYCTCKPGMFH